MSGRLHAGHTVRPARNQLPSRFIPAGDAPPLCAGLPIVRGMVSASPFLVLFAALFLAACSNVANSTRIDFAGAPLAYGPACDSALGSYALPKAFLQIQIGQTDPSTPPDIATTSTGGPVNTIRHPDPSLVFCLDYLASASSDDNIQVIKWPLPSGAQSSQSNTQNTPGATLSAFISAQSGKEPFLGAVTFNVTDQTAYIIEALIRSGFILGSGNAQFATRNATFTQNQIVADLEYDPFDRVESANINARLQKLGVCLMLEFYTFDPRVGIDNYCNDPLRYGTQPTPYTKAYLKAEETPTNPHWPGLLYRPRYSYRLFIYRSIDPGSRHWKLSQTTTVRLENLSPVISLGVTRAVFAGKSMSFVFNEGALQTACVAKTSEVEGFAQIPLQIAKSIVALPASIVSVQIGNANSQAQLVQAEQQLYLMQQTYLTSLMGQSATAPTGVPTTATTPTLPDPSNFTIPADLAPLPDIMTSTSPISGYGTDLLQGSNLSNICAGKS
jgi:hypothetical protein